MSFGLPENVLGNDENGNPKKGSELEYNQQRSKPLLLIMCIDAKPLLIRKLGIKIKYQTYTITFPWGTISFRISI